MKRSSEPSGIDAHRSTQPRQLEGVEVAKRSRYCWPDAAREVTQVSAKVASDEQVHVESTAHAPDSKAHRHLGQQSKKEQ
eukprot:CAMPEP_0119413748 /NCGR_PEP_ID=MMETSP1335-20130426/5724_1 /TAXON_ID=259385 /ORGANISM="Chrysoculter rhomboideus, Strain RCC1486" /LENGTH=79 /DNA_ID=CAMNT_0007438561 /DNA_START=196 /DNA_END=433 /DNA_ORIENTATION=+